MGEDRFKNVLLYSDNTVTPLSDIPDITTNTCTTASTITYHPGEIGIEAIGPRLSTSEIRAMWFGDSPAKNNEGIPPITDYDIYNDRALIVHFADGTFTKCVVDSQTEFDFFTGLAFCLMKKLLGKDGHKRFNAMMRKAIKKCGEIDKRHEDERAEEERRKAKQRKAKLKRAAKAAKARQEQINTQSAAMLDALRKFKADEGGCGE